MWKVSIIQKLIELEVRKQYQIKIRDRFVALENLTDNKDIDMNWENIKGISKSKLKRVLV
jgi:hypothetical protein